MRKQYNPLRTSIPTKSKIHPESAKYWDIVRKHNGSRKAMVKFICGIGDYSDRHDHFAVSFNVKAYAANLDAEHMWERLVREDIADFGSRERAHLSVCKHLFMRLHEEHQNQLWEFGQSSAWEGFKGTDTPYMIFTGDTIQWEFELRGRSGGHLVMTECEGINLRTTAEGLEELLTDKDDSGRYYVKDENLRRFFLVCVQNSITLTPKAASDEVEYRAIWDLWHCFAQDLIEADIKEYELRDRLSGDAKEILFQVRMGNADLAEPFRSICKLAGITIEGE